MENEDVDEQPSAEDRCINQVTCIFICHLAHGSSESAIWLHFFVLVLILLRLLALQPEICDTHLQKQL